MIILSVYVDGHLRLSETTTETAIRNGMDAIAEQITALRQHHRVAVTGEEDGVCYIIPAGVDHDHKHRKHKTAG